jgi:hypothetical protein
MLRHFSMQQADYLAAQREPTTAVALHPELKRYLGIGNSTGLGMAPFLINHPLLINQWIEMRETALATAVVASEAGVDKATMARLDMATERVIQHLGEIITADERQKNSNVVVGEELQALHLWLQEQAADLAITHYVWADLIQYAEQHWQIETQEVINTMLIELYPDLVDGLEEQMGAEESQQITPEMSVPELLEIIDDKYDWALAIDFSKHESMGAFWYRSEEKMEPRLGQTNIDMGMEKEMPLGIGRLVRECYDCMRDYNETCPGQNVAHFILKNPTFSGIVARMQTMAQSRYGDIRENLVHSDVLPIYLLRCKLSFFGVSKFDPRSRLWVRNTMFQGAPLISDFGQAIADDWQFPIKPVLTTQ